MYTYNYNYLYVPDKETKLPNWRGDLKYLTTFKEEVLKLIKSRKLKFEVEGIETVPTEAVASGRTYVGYDFIRFRITNGDKEVNISINNTSDNLRLWNYSESKLTAKEYLNSLEVILDTEFSINSNLFESPDDLANYINDNIKKLPSEFDCACLAYVFLRNFSDAKCYYSKLRGNWHFVIFCRGHYYQKNKGSEVYITNTNFDAFNIQTNIADAGLMYKVSQIDNQSYTSHVDVFDNSKLDVIGIIHQLNKINNLKFFSNKKSDKYSMRTFSIKSFSEMHSDLPGYKISWIKTKDRWSSGSDCKYRFHLVLTPIDKSKDIIVFKDYARYHTGHDQGYNSPMQYYLTSIIGGGGRNGSGVSSEITPVTSMLEYDWKHLNDYLTKGHTFSEFDDEKLDKAMMTYPPKTKVSEIKSQLEMW